MKPTKRSRQKQRIRRHIASSHRLKFRIVLRTLPLS